MSKKPNSKPTTRKPVTEIAFILDRSGSMEPHTEAAIAGFNEFLRDQQAVEGLARLSVKTKSSLASGSLLARAMSCSRVGRSEGTENTQTYNYHSASGFSRT